MCIIRVSFGIFIWHYSVLKKADKTEKSGIDARGILSEFFLEFFKNALNWQHYYFVHSSIVDMRSFHNSRTVFTQSLN